MVHWLRTSRTAILLVAGFTAFGGFGVPAAIAKNQTASSSETLSGDYLSAAVAGADHDPQAASKYYRRALALDKGNPDLMERAFASMLSAGEIDGSFFYATKLQGRGPHNTLANLALAIRAIKTGDFRQARDLLAKLGGADSSDVTALALTAWSEAGMGHTQKALATLAKLKGAESIGAYRAYHTALIDDLAGNVDDARKSYKEAQDLEPSTMRLVDARARFEARTGDIAEAKRLYGDFERSAPRNPLIKQGLADVEKGAATPRLIATPQQGAAEALFGLAASSGREGEDFAAILYLRLALFLDPSNGVAAVTLGEIYERDKSYEQAIAAYGEVPANSPLRQSTDLQIGLDLVALEKYDDAVAHMHKVIENHPDDLEAYAALGDALRANKNFADAADAYGKAIDLSGPPTPSNWLLYYDRGICLERSKQWPKAEADLKKALELSPDQPLVLNYLGYSWVDQGMNIDEAFKMLRRAVDLRPKDGYVIDSLGWAYYRMGRYDDAVHTLEKAIELKPNDATINNHLGDAYWHVGRKLEATFQWAHARDMQPEPEDLPGILKKIETGMLDDKPPTPQAVSEPSKADGG
ncbi:MAG: tetratricopeptide repeat protein [Hyphomicrobiales bacterium]|nr:tetratricopeptide repeat protein [Hyphomicrobiales bacterium]MBV9974054.1 tetratricopeptide repeat protein [Hyphomicrobiales bacterium]